MTDYTTRAEAIAKGELGQLVFWTSSQDGDTITEPFGDSTITWQIIGYTGARGLQLRAVSKKTSQVPDSSNDVVISEIATIKDRLDAVEAMAAPKHPYSYEQSTIDTGVSYSFLARPEIDINNFFATNGDLIHRPFDSDGPDWWTFGGALSEPPWNVYCAPYYKGDDGYGQVVRVENTRYRLVSGATLVQAKTQPYAATVGDTVDGWLRLEDL